MTWFENLPVQRKLGSAMLVTTTAALTLACSVFLAFEYRGYRRDIEHTVVTLAHLTADDSTAAVAFDDRPGAAQILEALRAEPQIVSAALYDANGRMMASFRDDPDEFLPPAVAPDSGGTSWAEEGFVTRVQPVTEGTRRLGTLYLRGSMAMIFLHMRTYAWVVLGVLVSSFGLAGLVAAQLRRVLARPILELANTASTVSARQDYALRARQYGNDELGRLTTSFNAMLATTQAAVGALRESEWSHRQLVRALPTAACMCDAQGCITIYNEAAVALWGRAPELGSEYWCGSFRMYNVDGTPLALDQSPLAVALREARAVRDWEIIVERPDGTRRNVLPHPEPIRDTAGAVVGIVNMLVDITEAKRANAAARQLAAIVESSDDAIIGKDLEGIITSWNRGAERLFGYTAAEMIGQSILRLIPPERQAEEPAIIQRVRNGECVEVYETTRRRADGTLIDVALVISPIKGADGRIVGASKIARDITARKRTEIALRISEAQLRLVTDNAPVLLVRVDTELRFTFVNRGYAERNGFTPQAMIGMRTVDVVGPEAYEIIRPHMLAALAGERVEFEVRIPYERIEPRWVNVIYVPERAIDGRIIGLLGVLSDTGARKEAELALKQARDEALAASRAKDDFLAALSHELRTPLNPVLLLASDAADDEGLPSAVRADFELIRKNVSLEARLIDDLLDLTGIARGKLRLTKIRCSLPAILEDAVTNVRGDLGEKRLRLTVEFSGPESFVEGDPVRLQQVFWNILNNALKFTPEDGWIAVKGSPHGETGTIVVEISDSGIGMNPDEIDRIFQPFAQGDHAAPGRGSHRFGGLGLGLAISRMLVELHGGRIRAVSPGRGHGSTIVVALPAAPEKIGAAEPSSRRTASAPPFGLAAPAHPPGLLAPARGSRRILLVEDHAATRQTLQQLLRNRGYAVAAVESAAEAQQLALAEKFDLVISDVGLPDRTGYELMADLRSLQPGLSGIALSGYGMEEDLNRSRTAGFCVHLVKPVTIGILEDAIARVPGPPATDQPLHT